MASATTAAAPAASTTASAAAASSRNNLQLTDDEASKVASFALVCSPFKNKVEPTNDAELIKMGKDCMGRICDQYDTLSKEAYEKQKAAELGKTPSSSQVFDGAKLRETELLIYSIYERCRKF